MKDQNTLANPRQTMHAFKANWELWDQGETKTSAGKGFSSAKLRIFDTDSSWLLQDRLRAVEPYQKQKKNKFIFLLKCGIWGARYAAPCASQRVFYAGIFVINKDHRPVSFSIWLSKCKHEFSFSFISAACCHLVENPPSLVQENQKPTVAESDSIYNRKQTYFWDSRTHNRRWLF